MNPLFPLSPFIRVKEGNAQSQGENHQELKNPQELQDENHQEPRGENPASTPPRFPFVDLQQESEDLHFFEGMNARGSKNEGPEELRPQVDARPKLPTVPGEYYAAIRLPDEMDQSQWELLHQLLDRIGTECNAEIIRPIDKYNKKLEQWYAGFMDRIRRKARSLVIKAKKSTKARREKWGFERDETSIHADADLEYIERVLDGVSVRDEMFPLSEHPEIINEGQPDPPKNLRLPEVPFDEEQVRQDILAIRRRKRPLLERLREARAAGTQTPEAPDEQTSVDVEAQS